MLGKHFLSQSTVGENLEFVDRSFNLSFFKDTKQIIENLEIQFNEQKELTNIKNFVPFLEKISNEPQNEFSFHKRNENNDFKIQTADSINLNIVTIRRKFIEGQSLSEVLFERGKFNRFEGLKIMLLISKVIKNLHSRQITLKNLNDQNILFDEKGQLNIVDNVLEILSLDRYRSTPPPEYICHFGPENIDSVHQNVKFSKYLDVYQFGIVAYELFVGKPPFNKSNWIQEVNEMKHDLVDIPGDVDLDVASLIKSCLSSDPIERPNSLKLPSLITRLLRTDSRKTSHFLKRHSDCPRNLIQVVSLNEITGKLKLNINNNNNNNNTNNNFNNNLNNLSFSGKGAIRAVVSAISLGQSKVMSTMVLKTNTFNVEDDYEDDYNDEPENV